MKNQDEIFHKANLLSDALNAVYDVEGQEVYVPGSIGISVCPEDGTTYTELLNCADKALYSVKDEGKGSYKLFT